MAENYYTADDVEQYIEYSHILYRKVVAVFMPNLHIENVTSDKFEEVKNSIASAIGTYGILEKVYRELHQSFNAWLFNDCLFTGHKGKETPKPISFIGSVGDKNVP